MTETRRAVLDLLRTGAEPTEGNAGDVRRDALPWLVQQLLEAEVSAQSGADRSERTAARSTQRNGSRSRPKGARMGTRDQAVPKLRTGT